MALSSLSVVANANRLRRFTPRPLAATTQVAGVDPLVEVGGSVEASHHTQRKETTMFGLFGKKKDTTTAKVVDPVCGMKINPADAAATRDHDGTTIHLLYRWRSRVRHRPPPLRAWTCPAPATTDPGAATPAAQRSASGPRTRRALLGRLRRIEGQVRGIARMVDGDADCIEILTRWLLSPTPSKPQP